MRGGAPVQIDHNIWLLLFFNITLILALSAVSYELLKRNTIHFKIAGCKSTGSQYSSNVSSILANRYLMIRRIMKIDSDDDLPHHLLCLQLQN